MFYQLIPHKVNFNKKIQEDNKNSNQLSRLILILPLANKQAVLFYNNWWFYHVQILNMNILYQGKLEGSVFDGVALSSDKVILTLIQKRSIVELDLINKKVTQIYKITSDSLYNSKKQVGQFFVSKLYSFNQSKSYYLQQNLPDQRKVKVIYFSSNKNKQLKKQLFQVRQFEAKNYIYSKLNQKQSLVRFKQNPQQNCVFKFQQINLQTGNIQQFQVNSPSSVLYSTVIDVRKIQDEKYLICLNTKNSQHEIFIYNKVEKTVETLCLSDKIMIRCININQNLNIGMFSFLYGKTPDSQIVTFVDLKNGKLIQRIQAKIDRLVVSKDQNYFIEYSVQNKGKLQSCFNILTLVNKRSHYLKMLQNLKIDSIYGQQFTQMAIKMLQ